MTRYEPQKIETKWQKQWEQLGTFKSLNPGEPGFKNQKKFYVLDMFPYPSGSGLHVGHASGYIGTDIVARRKRMEGYNVLHPMGWDAFGLPAEQYAIETGQHPRVTTEINTKNFRNQLKKIGLSYDWSREIDTSDPHYYKWTQWIFLKLYQKGLVYQKEMPVWWCEALKTVLANEEVINGRSERGNHPCERRPLRQWLFKITAYAERLLEDLDQLDWPESVKKMQSDWIGKSEGAEIDFQIQGSSERIRVFSTRPDTLMGVVALVLAPEHPLVPVLTTSDQKVNVEQYRRQASSRSDRDRMAESEDFTGVFIGSTAQHPLNPKLQIPIWIADYVLADYGTGAVMAVPAHDERDFLLAKKFHLPITQVIQSETTGVGDDDAATGVRCYTGEGKLINSGTYNGLNSQQARTRIIEDLTRLGLGQSKITYKIRDWIFSRQRYWGEPFPLLLKGDQVRMVDEKDLPVELPDMENFQPSSDGSSPLKRAQDWVRWVDPGTKEVWERVTDTMPGWAGSCWYFLRFMDPKNSNEAFSKSALDYWKNVDLYVGGASHAVMHLLYARFWHKVLFDLGIVPTSEPFQKLFNQGMVTAFAFKDSTGRLVPSDEVETRGVDYVRKSTGEKLERFISKMAKSLRNVINPDDVIDSRGCDVFRMYEMFMGPLDDEKPWADESIAGCEKFLKRVWAYFIDDRDHIRSEIVTQESESHAEMDRALYRCLKRIDDSFVNFNFNTAVAALMECLNSITDQKQLMSREQAELFIKMLNPFAPHLAHELWERLGHKNELEKSNWPEFLPEKLVSQNFELVIMLNGKLKKKASAPSNADQETCLRLAREMLGAEFPTSVKKVIFVPNKLINLVV